jgi:ribosomal-protein-alanine N-acetyltransferase
LVDFSKPLACLNFDYVVYNSVMEFANVWRENKYIAQVRVAESGDASAISRFLGRTPYSHMHVDWRLPLDWLGTPGFVVLPKVENDTGSLRGFMRPKSSIDGCLAVAADPFPSAWVRIAAVNELPSMLLALLVRAIEYLQDTAVTELNWLLTTKWPIPHLPALGFSQVNEIETYVKNDLRLPPVTAVPGLTIRPAELSDMVALEKIEAAAFMPMWRHSAETFTLAKNQALSFDVAEIDRQIVGFQLSSYTSAGAHLVRLTVDPNWQRQGIASAILAHALPQYRQDGLNQVSLNTQIDNVPSQFLYRKFGFSATGQRFPVWQMVL